MTFPTAAIKVTKMDAVHRQLNAAIRMWFSEDDPVAIHTLIAAAHEVLYTLYRKAGHAGLLFDSPIFDDKTRSVIKKAFKAQASFFKHADRDPDSTLDFNPESNAVLILYCTRGLNQMGEENPIEVIAFNWWNWINKPELFLPEAGHQNVPTDLLENLRLIKRTDFLQTCRDLAARNLLPGLVPPDNH